MKLSAALCAIFVSSVSFDAFAQGAPTARPAPAAPTAPAPGAPTAPQVYTPPQAAPAPAAPAPEPEPELELYKPSAQETAQFAPPPPKAAPKRPTQLIGGLLFDVLGFPVGNIRGVGNMLRARFGSRMAGFALGVYNGGEQVVIGFDAFRYAGVPVTEVGEFKVYALLPNLEVDILAGGSGSAFHVGTSVSGLRLAACNVLGNLGLEASARPTLGVWLAGNGNGVGPAMSVGGSLAVGLLF